MAINVYAEFMNEILEIVEINTSSISLNDLYFEVKCWYRECFPSDHIPNKFEFRDIMVDKYGPLKDGKWSGLRIKSFNIKDD